jgi:sterol desaturase/sphingolipid hydroxylase (fatty acid hydroxylase superfamily)
MTAPAESRRFGTGWISGVIAITLGAMGLGGVLCFIFPEQLTSPYVRDAVPLPVLRALLQFVIIAGFIMALVSLILRKRKILGGIALTLTVAAVALGGWWLPEREVSQRAYLGLDWFLLNLLLLCLLFVPMERAFARLKDQGVFRGGWQTDLTHFFVSHMIVQASVFLTLAPARLFFEWSINADLQHAIASQPAWLQFVEIIFVADFCEYWLHRFEHRIPILWRFHAIHHSAEHMDWLAGSRLHLVDIVLVRSLTFVPLYVLGFANGPVFAYLTFVSFHAVFIHANVRFKFGWLEHVIVTPRFHHWHHAAEAQAIDKNFAVHLPVLDRVFGSILLPPGDLWPAQYGIAGNPIPESYVTHTVYPFAPERFGRTSSERSRPQG